MAIITEGMIQQAITLARPSVQRMLRTKGLTLGPKYVNCSLRVRNMPVIQFDLGTVSKKWNDSWGEKKNFASIASRKRHECERGRANTSVIIATRPWTLQKGDYLYAGGAYHDGIAVGVSGAKGRTDEAIAETIINYIILLAQLETDKRIAEHKTRI